MFSYQIISHKPYKMRYWLTDFTPPENAQPNTIYLVHDDWDDFGHKISFKILLIDQNNQKNILGEIRIAPNREDIPDKFRELNENCFSLGSEEYYENLNKLKQYERETILRHLRDVAFDLEILDTALSNINNESVIRNSLFRESSESTVRGQLHRMAHGGARVTPYNFLFQPDYKFINHNPNDLHPHYGITPNYRGSEPLDFSIDPESLPPSNIHVLVGRNGVGKTTFIEDFLSTVSSDPQNRIFFIKNPPERDNSPSSFANIIGVSLSAFDNKKTSNQDKITFVNLNDLNKKIGSYVENCLNGHRLTLVNKALKLLSFDPIFKECGIPELFYFENINQQTTPSKFACIYQKLSTGHKAILLATFGILAKVEETSVVVIDEPDAHLHPPLISSFIRMLSEILMDRNAVGLIATHSPVIVQEIPRNCIWKIQRTGSITAFSRPEIETFGENVGTLTREIFGLEGDKSGFYKLLEDKASQAKSYEDLLQIFNGQLGSEARAYAHILMEGKESNNYVL